MKTPEKIEFEELCVDLKILLDYVRKGDGYNREYCESQIFHFIKRGGELLNIIGKYDKEYIDKQSLKCF